jgi:hypothetical protein
VKSKLFSPRHEVKQQDPLGSPGEGRCAPFYDDLADVYEYAPKTPDKRFGNAQDVPQFSTFGDLKTK